MNRFRERLLDLLLEAKRHELLHNKYNESEEDLQRREEIQYNQESDENNYARKCKNSIHFKNSSKTKIFYLDLRRKVVGISDNPF